MTMRVMDWMEVVGCFLLCLERVVLIVLLGCLQSYLDERPPVTSLP